MPEQRLCSLTELAEGSASRIDLDGHSLAVVRLGDKVYVIGDTCSHARISLSEGDVDEDECALECPKHGSLFSLESGEPLTLPAVKPVPTYATRVEGDTVYVEL